MPQPTGLRGVIIAAAMGIALSACAPIVRNHGYVPREDELAQIIVGADSRDTVAELIGPPGAAGLLNDSGFYYVASSYRTIGPFAPKETSREVLAIYFDEDGIVRDIARYGLEDGRAVVLSRRVTDSNVEDNTLIRQLLGSIGRFDAGQFLAPN